MAGHSAALWRAIQEDVRSLVWGLFDRRTVLDVVGSTATVRDSEGRQATIGVARGVPVAAGDDVVVLRVWDSEIVVWALGPATGDSTDDRHPIRTRQLAIEPPDGTGATEVLIYDPDGAPRVISLDGDGRVLVDGTVPVGGSIARRSDNDDSTTGTGAWYNLDTFLNLKPNEQWAVEWRFRVGCSGTGGVKFGVFPPSGASGFCTILSQGASTGTLESQVQASLGSLHAAAFVRVATSWGHVHVHATVVNGATQGNVFLGFASAVSGQTSTLFTNGQMKATRIA